MAALNRFQKNCIALTISQMLMPSAQASLIMVDAPIFNPGSGCTLVEAIRTANLGSLETSPTFGDCVRLTDDSDDGNTIVLAENSTHILINADSGSTGNPNNFTGLPFVTSKLTIQGNNSIVQRVNTSEGANGSILGPSDMGTDGFIPSIPDFRILTVTGSDPVSVENLTITGGKVDNYQGGGVYLGANANVNLQNVTITANQAMRGGGLLNRGTLNISDSTISDNTALQRGGGIYGRANSFSELVDSQITGNRAQASFADTANRNGGAGIYIRSASLNLQRSSISNNSAVSVGGGIVLQYANNVSLSEVTISDNSSDRLGGGIFAIQSPYLTLLKSTVQSNSARSGGGMWVSLGNDLLVDQTTFFNNQSDYAGGLYLRAFGSAIVNSTFSENSATFFGGGIAVLGRDSLSLQNCTITGNSATDAGGGIFIENSDSATIRNNIIAGNLLMEGNIGSQLANNNASSTFSDISGNLFGDASSTEMVAFDNFEPSAISNTFAFDTPLSQILLSLSDNGGLSPTHALPAGSPAINAGNNSSCPSVDQRNINRNDGRCDIGAYELEDDEACFVVKTPESKVVVFCL